MPRGDGTGPQGSGMLTGRGLGPCGTAGSEGMVPRGATGFFGRLRRRFGFGRNVRDGGRTMGLGRGRGTGGRNRNR